MLLHSVKPPTTDIPAYAGGAVLGGVSQQQPRNPPSGWEADAGKAHTGSQQTVTHTHKRDLLSQSRKLVVSTFFICVLELPKSSALLPLMGFKLLTLCRSYTELVIDLFTITPDGRFLVQVPSKLGEKSET